MRALDPATARFDAELAAAVAARDRHGRGGPDRLRFWQRAGIRGLVEHARTCPGGPPALAALEAARGGEQPRPARRPQQRRWAERDSRVRRAEATEAGG